MREVKTVGMQKYCCHRYHLAWYDTVWYHLAQTQLASFPTKLAIHGQQVSHTSCKKQEKKQRPKTTSLALACWNIGTMQNSDKADRPQWCSALVAQELARLNIDIAARSVVGNCSAKRCMLLGLCVEQGLTITDSLFQQKARFKMTRQHPYSRHWHLLDYVLEPQKDLCDMLHTRVMPRVDCNPDHRLGKEEHRWRSLSPTGC